MGFPVPLVSTVVLLLVLLQLVVVVDCTGGGGGDQPVQAEPGKEEEHSEKAEKNAKIYLETLVYCESLSKKYFRSVRKLLKKEPAFVNENRSRLTTLGRLQAFHNEIEKAVSDHETDKGLDIKQLKLKKDYLKALNTQGGLYTLLLSKQICEDLEKDGKFKEFMKEHEPKAKEICAELRAKIDTFIVENIQPGHMEDKGKGDGGIIKSVKKVKHAFGYGPKIGPKIVV